VLYTSRTIQPDPHSLQLLLSEQVQRDIDDVWYRYGSPALIVAITWHETRASFGQYLHNRLSLSYLGNEDFVGSTGNNQFETP